MLFPALLLCPGIEAPAQLSAEDEKTIADLESACAARKPLACHVLSTLYVQGEVVPKSETIASRWLRMGCEQGELAACNDLAWLLVHGGEIKRDEAQAAALYRAACDKGFARACAGLPWLAARSAGLP